MTEHASQIEKMAAEHCAAWTAGDAARTADLFAEDGTLSVNGGPPHTGRAELIESARALMESFPGVRVSVTETRCAGDRAVFLWVLEGVHAETGNTVTLPGWHEWELDGDLKVARCRGFYDAEDLARQVAGT